MYQKIGQSGKDYKNSHRNQTDCICSSDDLCCCNRGFNNKTKLLPIRRKRGVAALIFFENIIASSFSLCYIFVVKFHS